MMRGLGSRKPACWLDHWGRRTLVALAMGGLLGALCRQLVASGATGAEARADRDWPSISLVPLPAVVPFPVQVTHAGDGSGRLFVVERQGRVWIVRGGVLQAVPFLDISERVSCCEFEQGLLGLAFAPNFVETGYFYLLYTNVAGDSVLARFHVPADRPDLADPASETDVLYVAQPSPVHNGSQLAFGPDGFLYAGLGDGGMFGDPSGNGQNPATLLGKVLRLDVTPPRSSLVRPITATHALFLPSVQSSFGYTYTVPASNPFTQTTGFRPEIWALGVRNPWRLAFDRVTGDLYFGDVGEDSYEEVNFQPASSQGGENYGWRIMEGAHCFNSPVCDDEGLTLPVAEWAHGGRQCVAVVGGTVYRGAEHAGLYGLYLSAEFCSGEVWGLRFDGTAWESALLYDAPFLISAIGEDEAGNWYVAPFMEHGQLYRIVEDSCKVGAVTDRRCENGRTSSATEFMEHTERRLVGTEMRSLSDRRMATAEIR